MRFGMIGAGTVSQAIATHPLRTGHEVIFSNSRGPDTLTELVAKLGAGASAGTIAEAGEADFVVLAVHWGAQVRNALRALLTGFHAVREDVPHPMGKFTVHRSEVPSAEWGRGL